MDFINIKCHYKPHCIVATALKGSRSYSYFTVTMRAHGFDHV